MKVRFARDGEIAAVIVGVPVGSKAHLPGTKRGYRCCICNAEVKLARSGQKHAAAGARVMCLDHGAEAATEAGEFAAPSRADLIRDLGGDN